MQPSITKNLIHCGRQSGFLSLFRLAKMTFQLLPISLSQLQDLSQSVAPASLEFAYEPDALPHSFVAAASLAAIRDAGCPAWCSTYYVVRSSNMKIVGSAAFMGAPHLNSVEIGYGMSSAVRNQGAATCAVKDLVSLALRNGMESVFAEASPDNGASEKVLQKTGFKRVSSRVDAEDGEVGNWLFTAVA